MADNNLKRTLMDIRKMRRSVKMRAENDPEIVSQTLETILQEAIALSTSGDGTMSRAAIKELKQVRRSLIAQQIDAGDNTAKYLGSFSAVLDTIDQTAAEVENNASSERNNYRESLTDSLPSSDTMIAAIMTANPILGYSMKMTRDLIGSSKRSSEKRKSREKEEADLRKSRLEEQRLVLEEQLETEEMKRTELEDASSDDIVIPPTPEYDTYKAILEEIKSEIHKLNVIWGDSSDVTEDIRDESRNTITRLEQIRDEDAKQNDLVRQRDNVAGLRGVEADFEGGSPSDTIDSLVGGSGSDAGNSSSMLGGLFGGGGLAAFMAPISSIFGVIKKVGSLFLKLGKGSLILAAVVGIYDFVDGIMRAGEILGLDNVDWKDRVKVGVANILSGLLAPINWITSTFFGFDMMGGKSRDEMTKQYFEFFDNFVDNMIGMAKWIGNSILDTFSSWTEKGTDFVGDLAMQAFAPIKELIENIKNYIKDKILELTTKLTPDFLKEFFSDDADDEDIKKKIDSGIRNMSGSVSRTSRAITQSEMKEADAKKAATVQANVSSTNVNAPSTTQTTNNTSQYMGNGSSDNREPAHRRFGRMNNVMDTGNL
jgi:hypothetical protein